MKTTKSEAHGPAHEGRAARILVGVLPSLILAACAYAGHGSRPDVTAAHAEAAAAPTTKYMIRPRAGAGGERLGEASARMSLREVQTFHSGCRMVEAPADVSIDALRSALGADYEVEPDHVYHTAAAPSNPLYTQDEAAVMNAIAAPQAWGVTQGTHENLNVVAVLDTGADYNNPDLSPAIHVNVKELTGTPGVDNDGDGYASDIYGVDVYDGTGDPMDHNGHGTEVASIIGGQGRNGNQLQGVAPGSRLLILKCFDDQGETDDATLITCYEYMTNANNSGRYHIRVANNSWGGMPEASCLEQAISDAGNAGILSVFSAGSHSQGQDLDYQPEYPASSNLATTITVASADLSGTLTSDSNWGPSTVDLVAPGVNITTLGTCRSGPTDCAWLEQVSGTSFAAPFVTAAAALLFSEYPSLTPAQAKQMLLANVTPYPQLTGWVRSGGMLNIYAALANTPPSGPPATTPGTSNYGTQVGQAVTPFVDGTYTIDVAEFPTSPQDNPPITPNVGYLFVRTNGGVQEQRWLLQGWDGHYFLRPPRQSMGMIAHPSTLTYTNGSGNPAVVQDLPSWIAFAGPQFVSSGPTRSTYAMLAATVSSYAGAPLAPPFSYPAYIGPEPPATAQLEQLDYFTAFPVLVTDPATNAPELSGFGFAVSEGPYQGREHWVLAPGASTGTIVVGSSGAPLGIGDFAAQMNAPAWQPGSTLVLGSVQYYPYFVAE